MTDRELLERAARAAGLDAEFHPELGYGPEGMWLKGERTPDNNRYWNPLANDGDALRLAATLRIDVAFDPSGFAVGAQVSSNRECDGCERLDGDSAATTRRAIVRAAAAMDGGE